VKATLAPGLLLAAAQGLHLRLRAGALAPAALGRTRETLEQVNAVFGFLEEDRPLEGELRRVLELTRDEHWRLPYGSEPSVG